MSIWVASVPKFAQSTQIKLNARIDKKNSLYIKQPVWKDNVTYKHVYYTTVEYTVVVLSQMQSGAC